MSFSKALPFTLKWEGGFTANPEDPGNWTGGAKGRGVLRGTNMGISAAAFPDLDIRNITTQQVHDIYRTKYWEAISGDSRPFPEAMAIFDFAVNSGVNRALSLWVESAGVEDYLDAREEFLVSLSAFPTFGRGWVRRVIDLRRFIRDNTDKSSVHPDVEVIQIYQGERMLEFYPAKVTMGVTDSQRVKIMARLSE